MKTPQLMMMESSQKRKSAEAEEESPATKQAKIMLSSMALPILPVRCRFMPAEDELVTYYLARMIRSEQVFPFVHPANVYAFHPLALTAAYPPAKHRGNREWFFFTRREAKYPNGKRPDRRAGDGFWKASSGLQTVKDEEGMVVGRKMTLVYYESSPDANRSKIKTNWIMHEFQHASVDFQSWTLCKIHRHGKQLQPEPLAPSPLESCSVLLDAPDSTHVPLVHASEEEDEILSWINSPSHESAGVALPSSHTTTMTILSPEPPHYQDFTPSPWLDRAASDMDCFDDILAQLLDD